MGLSPNGKSLIASMCSDSDKQRRKRLAALPFSEKLKILEKMRDRDRAIAAAGLRKAARPKPTNDERSKP